MLRCLTILITFLSFFIGRSLTADEFSLSVKQITHGPKHHFFGYIGQSLTTPWNSDGQYMLALQTDFHDRMPDANDAAQIVLIDTKDNYRVIPIESTRAWNFQQGTMFYWHPWAPQTQFFFNDRDAITGQVFTVLYDVQSRQRLCEYRVDHLSVANGGVSPSGRFFLAINYGRMARLRPVTGYPAAPDPTAKVAAPENDGIFHVNIRTGQPKLIVSFRQLRELLCDKHPNIDKAEFYINHTLINRNGQYVYFFARARLGDDPMAVNIPCSAKTDGSQLTAHAHIGGHPEWDKATVVIGAQDGKQIRYDILQQKVVGQIGTPESIPKPRGDVSLSRDGNWFACGFGVRGGNNQYSILRRSDNAFVQSGLFSRGPHTKGPLRIDPAPRWNRNQTAILVPGWTSDNTRQLHLIEIKP